MCKDRDVPVWLKTLRNDVLKHHNQSTSDEEEIEDDLSPHDFDLFPLFLDNTSDMGASDLLMPRDFNTNDIVGASDLLMSNDINCTEDDTGMLDQNRTLPNQIISSLDDLSEGLDQTVIYQIDDPETITDTCSNSLPYNRKEKRVRKKPGYLTDYFQE